MGPSGSGKSTLMHILAGLDRPTSGTVALAGVELSGLDDRKLTQLRRDQIGFIFQTFNLLPVLNAEENILLPLSIAGRKPDREWLDRLVDTVGIRDRLTHRPAELSGGQQQRVAVARALVSRPAVVFADEPTGNLDSKASGDVLELLRHAVDDFGQTVVMVTHDAHAASYADRLLVLADGRIVHDGAAVTAEQALDLMKSRAADAARSVLRGFSQRKLRVLLTGIAIALGVALMAGTYILTDTINQSFAGIFKTAPTGDDVVVTPDPDARQRDALADLADHRQRCSRGCARCPAWPKAAGGIFTTATFLDVHGKRLTPAARRRSSPATLPSASSRSRRSKAASRGTPSEVAIDQATAERARA